MRLGNTDPILHQLQFEYGAPGGLDKSFFSYKDATLFGKGPEFNGSMT